MEPFRLTSLKDPPGWEIAPEMSHPRFFAQTIAARRSGPPWREIRSAKVQYFNPDGTVLYQKGSTRMRGPLGVEGDKFCSDVSTDVRHPSEAEPNRAAWQCLPSY